MSISVVTVALNAAKDLPLTIESVLGQRFDDFEYILLDGGSIDNTFQVVNAYSQEIHRFAQTEDSSIFDAMNRSLEFCTKEFVIFLNAKDRFVSENVLADMWSCKASDVDLFFGDHIYINGRREILTRAADFELTFKRLERGEVSHRWHSSIPCHQSTFTRVDLLRRRMYDTRLEICADHDFMFKAFSAGAKFQYIDETVCHYFGGGFSSLREERCRLEFVKVYRAHSFNPGAVDSLFYGDGASPFSPQTGKTGLIIAGAGPFEGPYLEQGIVKQIAWCSARGFTMSSPNGASSVSCKIHGYNIFSGQTIECLGPDGESMGMTCVPVGVFSVEIVFNCLCAAGAVVQFITSEYAAISDGDRRAVCLAISEASFVTADSVSPKTLTSGDIVRFDYNESEENRSMLLSGWSDQEEDHVWSVGYTSILLFRVDETVSKLVIYLSGNPFVSDEERRVELTLNGRSICNLHLQVTSTSVSIQLPSTTNGGNAHLCFRPSKAASAPGDERMLGVSLERLDAI